MRRHSTNKQITYGRNNNKERLTSTELGKLWATFMGNSMSECVLAYFMENVEDKKIKKIVLEAKKICESILTGAENIFHQDNVAVPFGFTKEDVNLGAPRLFKDEFYLHYLRYTGKAGLNLYSIAIPLVTRKDVREFFIKCHQQTVQLLTEVNEELFNKGYMRKPPTIPPPDKIKFIKGQKFLNGYLGHKRPLQALEITHLYDNIDNNVTSKALLVGFSQVAHSDRCRKFFIRGKKLANKHVDLCTKKLEVDNLPTLSFLDHLVTNSTFSPFSDKLMVAHKIDMFSMKIRSYANAMSLSSRRDLSVMYTRMITDVGLYVEDAANIAIDNQWMELPPEAIDREDLSLE